MAAARASIKTETETKTRPAKPTGRAIEPKDSSSGAVLFTYKPSKNIRALQLGPALLVHVGALSWYLRVWLWHFTPAASTLPGCYGFGWFFKYLTFYSYTVQLVQLSLCCIADFARVVANIGPLDRLADDVSCAVFGMANVVTLMYYGIDAATQDLVEGGVVDRPRWLGMSVHLFNTATVWLDLLLAYPRTFSKRSQHLSLSLVLAYVVWILVCSHFNGFFPYPFLNKLPWPQGFLGVAVGALLLFYLIFQLGRHLSAVLLRLKSMPAPGR